MWSSQPIFWVISGNKGAFFPSTSGTDGNIYYSKHQSCIFLLFSREHNFGSTMLPYVMEPKKPSAVFRSFLVDFHVLYCMTGQRLFGRATGKWVKALLQRAAPVGAVVMAVACFLSLPEPRCVRDTVCVGKTGYCCGADLKTNRLRRTQRRAWHRTFIHSLSIYSFCQYGGWTNIVLMERGWNTAGGKCGLGVKINSDDNARKKNRVTRNSSHTWQKLKFRISANATKQKLKKGLWRNHLLIFKKYGVIAWLWVLLSLVWPSYSQSCKITVHHKYFLS